MGQRSVVFHAFLACLVSIADAVGVAHSGLNSLDFYRSRQFRTTNSTALGASIQDSASTESVVAVLDDLSRKSRVLLAQKHSGADGHRLLTWNAGGGAPQPEFLGGPWEEHDNKLFSEIEKMTGVLLFEIAGCKVDFVTVVGDKDKYTTDFRKYKDRYEETYDNLQKFKEDTASYKPFEDKLAGLKFETLLRSLKSTFNGEEGGEEGLPKWTANGKEECTLQSAIADSLKLCPSEAAVDKAAAEDKKKKGDKTIEVPTLPCDKFGLGTEGCWKMRGALPVYGARFFELYGELKNKKGEGRKQYWTKYMAGLQTQDYVAEKGCPKGSKKGVQPGKHVGKDVEESATYEIDGIKTTEPTPASFKFEEWSKTAAWDTLVFELTDLSVQLLNAIGKKELTLEEGDGDGKTYKAVPYIDDDAAGQTITKIVKGAEDALKPDVIFLQEAKLVGGTAGWFSSYDIKRAEKDTAIHVRKEFGGGIHDEASDDLQKAWAKWRGEKHGKDVVTVAMTAEDPTVMLFSIHADSDGNECAKWLQWTVDFYQAAVDPIQKKYAVSLTHMYIGMDANVQPPYGHLSFGGKKKGWSFEDLKGLLPDKMKMVIPKTKTVKKVRSFLQTQFSKIGKDDEEMKDLIFVYPYDEGLEGQVFSAYDAKRVPPFQPADVYEEELKGNGKSIYYPKDEWPVDHFMSFATISGTVEKEEDTSHPFVKGAKHVSGNMCKALKRAVRKTKYCFTKQVPKKGEKGEKEQKKGEKEEKEETDDVADSITKKLAENEGQRKAELEAKEKAAKTAREAAWVEAGKNTVK